MTWDQHFFQLILIFNSFKCPTVSRQEIKTVATRKVVLNYKRTTGQGLGAFIGFLELWRHPGALPPLPPTTTPNLALGCRQRPLAPEPLVGRQVQLCPAARMYLVLLPALFLRAQLFFVPFVCGSLMWHPAIFSPFLLILCTFILPHPSSRLQSRLTPSGDNCTLWTLVGVARNKPVFESSSLKNYPPTKIPCVLHESL